MKHISCPKHLTYRWVMSRTWLIHMCCDACNETSVLSYNSFHWECITPETHQIEKLRFLGVSRYKFKLRPWLHLNLYWGIWVSGFGGFGKCTIFSENSHTWHHGTYENVIPDAHAHAHAHSLSLTHHRTHTYETHSYLSWCIPMKLDGIHTLYDAFILFLDLVDLESVALSVETLIRDMTHSYLSWRIPTKHDAFICDMTHVYVTWWSSANIPQKIKLFRTVCSSFQGTPPPPHPKHTQKYTCPYRYVFVCVWGQGKGLEIKHICIYVGFRICLKDSYWERGLNKKEASKLPSPHPPHPLFDTHSTPYTHTETHLQKERKLQNCALLTYTETWTEKINVR